MANPRDFYTSYLPHAQRVSERTGLDPRLVMAQAALETGYGKHAPNNNFFGIKSHGRSGGSNLQTQEFENGQMVTKGQSFRGYSDPAQSFDDYADFITQNPRYQGVLNAQGLEGQINAMARSGYATDPNYGQKLASIANNFDPNAQVQAAPGRQSQPRVSTQGQAPQQASEPGQERERIGGFVGKMFPNLTRDSLDRISLALMSMSGHPTPGMQQMMGNISQRQGERRKEGRAAQQRNKTVERLEMLAQSGNQQAVRALEFVKAGGRPMDGLRMAFEQGEAPAPYTDAAKAAADLRAGYITEDQYRSAVSGDSGMTGAVETLHQRAIRGGLEPGSDAYRQFMVEGGTKSGMSLEVGPDGAVRFGTGGASMKPLTEGQSKDTTYAVRAEGALPVLDRYDSELASLGERALNADPTGIFRGRMQSPQYQMARQAGDEFLQAILRKDTGAAITADEQTLYGQTYLPQPGDGPEVIQQKRTARARALEALKAGMPPSAIVAQEKALSEGGGQAASGDGNATQPPEFLNEEDRELWEYMNEADRKILMQEYEAGQ